jgi:mRNA-degrading endonuclease RelE of RelBE toxin-antitoxin system
MKWGLVIGSRAKRQLRRLSPSEREHIDRAFGLLCTNPFDPDSKLLRGSAGGFRYRTGDWRILYDLLPEHKIIVVTAVKRRGSNTY